MRSALLKLILHLFGIYQLGMLLQVKTLGSENFIDKSYIICLSIKKTNWNLLEICETLRRLVSADWISKLKAIYVHTRVFLNLL